MNFDSNMVNELMCYKTLNLKRDCTPADVNEQFLKIREYVDPANGGNERDMERLTQAKMILSKPAQKAEYDKALERLGIQDGLEIDPQFTARHE